MDTVSKALQAAHKKFSEAAEEDKEDAKAEMDRCNEACNDELRKIWKDVRVRQKAQMESLDRLLKSKDREIGSASSGGGINLQINEEVAARSGAGAGTSPTGGTGNLSRTSSGIEDPGCCIANCATAASQYLKQNCVPRAIL